MHTIGGNLHIDISYFREVDISNFKDRLTVTNPEYLTFSRFKDARYSKAPEEFLYFYKIYKYGKTTIMEVPRNFIEPDYDTCEDIRVGVKKHFGDFKSIFRDYQKEYYLKLLASKSNDIVMQMPCGHGKCFMALWRASYLGLATIVVVPNMYLANQWLSEVKVFLPDCRVTICENTKDWHEKSIYIINVDRLSAWQNTFEASFYNYFGHAIWDECHVIGAPTFHPLVSLFPARYRTALTATFRREDGVDKILKYHFGEVISMPSQFKEAKVIPFYTGVKIPLRGYTKLKKLRSDSEVKINHLSKGDVFTAVSKETKKVVIARVVEIGWDLKAEDYDTGEFFSVNTDSFYSFERYSSSIIHADLDTAIAKHSFRNKMLISILARLLDSGRNILFLSKRREKLDLLYKAMLTRGYKAVLVVGKKGSKETISPEEVKKAQIVFGITQLAKMGLDADQLDTLVLHHPIKDIEQARGRVERYKPGKKDPLIIYPIDNIDIYKGMYYASLKYFKDLKVEKIVKYTDIKI